MRAIKRTSNEKYYTSTNQVPRNRSGCEKSEENPFYKSDYASLDEVIDTVRAEAGKFGLPQLVDFENANIQKADVTIYVKTIVLHDSGESFESRTPVLTKTMPDHRRWGQASHIPNATDCKLVLRLPSEDDDGNSAEPQQNKRPRQKLKTKRIMVCSNKCA